MYAFDPIDKLTRRCGFLVVSLLPTAAIAAGEATTRYVQSREGDRPTPVVAVDNVCAWPNLTVLPGGTIVATIHNQPSHLKRPADLECWASEDGGRTWAKRGTPGPRDNPRVARGNVAVGVAPGGDLIVVASGWSDPLAESRGTILPPIVSRSTDGGRTWTIDANAFPGKWPEIARTKASPQGYLVPFGDVLAGDDGALRVGLYGGNPGATFVYCSRDDGKTWGEPVVINTDVIIHEPALFHLGEGQWLAAARLNGLDLYASDDDAKTWAHRQKLTGPQQHPGHFTRLTDGSVLLSYGNRLNPKGVDVRVSDDEGTTWSEPFRVVDFQGDGGYPSSVQLPDGQVLTAYYAQRIAGHNRYHMGVVVWDPAKTRAR
jgi:Neuraminidase (sialidase)